tara:strand:- start:753 stop:1055 length:303 start_codon:yes stop_codon:yes gene_type:complete
MWELPKRLTAAAEERGINHFPSNQRWEKSHVSQADLVAAKPGPIFAQTVIHDFEGVEKSSFSPVVCSLIAGKPAAVDPIIYSRLQKSMPSIDGIDVLLWC